MVKCKLGKSRLSNPPIPTIEITGRYGLSTTVGSLNNIFTKTFLTSSRPFTSVVSIIEMVIGLSIGWSASVGTNL
uniref:Putative disease resistance protein RGA3 n=1 Tax=Rhizophora mucronata TaxID=61149 RepID=A0A2P2MJM0_RHIMU